MAVTVTTPGLVVVEHEVSVPLDHARPDGERITVFAREVADPDGRDRPFLVFLQGGPGSEAPRPSRRPSNPGWIEWALPQFRVLMLDQRGTGRSSPIGVADTDRLQHFRADSIVRDAEMVREHLGVDRWTVLGQSFGGFCVLTYLSFAPEGLREALITGGVPPLGNRIDDLYRATFARLTERVRRYHERYPDDERRLRALRRRLDHEDVRLPSGDRLTTRRLAQLGSLLGMSDGAEELHYLLELPPESPAFLHDVDRALDFARNPLYAVLHEACWADGGSTRWAAERVLPQDAAWTGEHVFPWMFEEYGALAPMREAAGALAEREWPRLYDLGVLASNEVPVAAAVYAEDMYVERALSEETAAAVRGMRVWLTNEYEHNGLRAAGGRILGHLLDLVRGRA